MPTRSGTRTHRLHHALSARRRRRPGSARRRHAKDWTRTRSDDRHTSSITQTDPPTHPQLASAIHPAHTRAAQGQQAASRAQPRLRTTKQSGGAQTARTTNDRHERCPAPSPGSNLLGCEARTSQSSCCAHATRLERGACSGHWHPHTWACCWAQGTTHVVQLLLHVSCSSSPS